MGKIRSLENFMVALNDVKWSNTLIANHYKYYLGELQHDKQILCLDDYPEFTVIIGTYIRANQKFRKAVGGTMMKVWITKYAL